MTVYFFDKNKSVGNSHSKKTSKNNFYQHDKAPTSNKFNDFIKSPQEIQSGN